MKFQRALSLILSITLVTGSVFSSVSLKNCSALSDTDYLFVKYMDPDLKELETNYGITVKESPEYTVLKIEFDQETWKKIIAELEKGKDRIGNIPNRFHEEFCTLLFNRLNIDFIPGVNNSSGNRFSTVIIPEYGWLDEYEPFENNVKDEKVSVFVDFYDLLNFADKERDNSPETIVNYKGEYLEIPVSELALRAMNVAVEYGDSDYYTDLSLIAYDSAEMTKLDKPDIYNLTDFDETEKEKIFLSEFLEKPTDELLALLKINAPLKSAQPNPYIRAFLTKKLWEDAIKELEPEREYLKENPKAFQNKLINVVMTKLHLKGVFDCQPISLGTIRINLPESDTTKSYENVLDKDYFSEGYNIWELDIYTGNIAQLSGDKSGFTYTLNGENIKVTPAEAVCRAKYVIKNYANPEYYKDIDAVIETVEGSYLNPMVKSGDLNSDSYVDLTDLSLLSLYLIGDYESDHAQANQADIDKDGNVTLADLARLQQYLSKKIESL